MTSKSTVYLSVRVIHIRDEDDPGYIVVSAVDPCFPPRVVWSHTWSDCTSGIPLATCLTAIYDGLKEICTEYDVSMSICDKVNWVNLEKLLRGRHGDGLYRDLDSLFAGFVGNE